MSLVWLNIEPNHGPQTASASAASKPARGPAIRRAVAQTAAMPPMPISGHSTWRITKTSTGSTRAEQDRHDVEQPAVEIEILVAEHRAVGEAAGVIGQDQFAVAVLDLFVVGDRVVAKGQQRDREQRRDQQPRRDIERIVPRPARPRTRPRVLAGVRPGMASPRMVRALCAARSGLHMRHECETCRTYPSLNGCSPAAATTGRIRELSRSANSLASPRRLH